VVLVQRDVPVRADLVFQRGGDGPSGRVGGVDDAPLRVAALACQVIVVERAVAAGLGQAREGDALVDQPGDGVAAALHGEAHRRFVAQAGAGHQRVGHVRLDGVPIAEHRRHAALRVQAGALGQRPLGQDAHRRLVGQAQGQAEAGRAAADDEYLLVRV
jgi:hypothetical protein